MYLINELGRHNNLVSDTASAMGNTSTIDYEIGYLGGWKIKQDIPYNQCMLHFPCYVHVYENIDREML